MATVAVTLTVVFSLSTLVGTLGFVVSGRLTLFGWLACRHLLIGVFHLLSVFLRFVEMEERIVRHLVRHHHATSHLLAPSARRGELENFLKFVGVEWTGVRVHLGNHPVQLMNTGEEPATGHVRWLLDMTAKVTLVNLHSFLGEYVSRYSIDAELVVGVGLRLSLSLRLKCRQRISFEEAASKEVLGWTSGVVEAMIDLNKIFLPLEVYLWSPFLERTDRERVLRRVRVARIRSELNLDDRVIFVRILRFLDQRNDNADAFRSTILARDLRGYNLHGNDKTWL